MGTETTARNIILVGYMGTGKSTVGRLIAKRLGLKFVDTDAEIEKTAGKPIPRIFKEDGEAAFRNLESETLRQVLEKDNQVVSTGGGIVLKEKNRRLLQRNGYCVWLKAEPETIFRRVSNSSNRPLLQTSNPRDTIARMLAEREANYAEVAEMTVGTDHLTAGDIAYGIGESAQVFFSDQPAHT